MTRRYACQPSQQRHSIWQVNGWLGAKKDTPFVEKLSDQQASFPSGYWTWDLVKTKPFDCGLILGERNLCPLVIAGEIRSHCAFLKATLSLSKPKSIQTIFHELFGIQSP
jgi:hypothetical protein